MKFSQLFMGWIVFGLISSAFASDDQGNAADWVKKMGQAVRGLDYDGVFVSSHGNQLQSMRIVHSVSEGRERKWLISLNGIPREMISDTETVVVVQPESRVVAVSKSPPSRAIPSLAGANPEGLSATYDFRMLNDDRVAGRAAKVVLIVPKDNYRYGYRLHLDAEHALPLKTEMLDSSGQSVGQIMFAQLIVRPIQQPIPTLEELKQRPGYSWIQRRPELEIPADKPCPWEFKHLPAGFILQMHSFRPGSDTSPEGEHFVFSDGLASLSVYIERKDEQSGLQGESRMGAVSAFGLEVAGHQVTIVGEVPAQTVRHVADAVEYLPEKD